MVTAKEKKTVKTPKAPEKKITGRGDIAVEQKLKALYDLQMVDSKIDEIRTIRGELPLEVQDLEDEIEGLDTRVKNIESEVNGLEEFIKTKKNEIKDSQALTKKYEKQQKNVRNNREYDSLSKEIEFQSLEMQLAEKKINEHKASIESKAEFMDAAKDDLKERQNDLKFKKKELDDIVEETEKEEKKLLKKSQKAEKIIDERFLVGYKRIRENARNGLAVVSVERSSCGGCFNKIPPQRQLDIKLHKKVIVCEHCGRILVDSEIADLKL